MNPRALFFIYLSTVLSCSVLEAKEYRIKPSDGSLEYQLTAILSAVDSLPGTEAVTIRIEKGYYEVTNTIHVRGRNHPITIIGGKSTIISGSITIDEWEVLPNGFWKSRSTYIDNAGLLPDQLYVNGYRAMRSKTPNVGFYQLKNGIKEGFEYGALLDNKDIDLESAITGTDVPFLSIYRKWTVSKRRLSRISTSNNAIYFTGKDFPSYNPLTTGNGFVLENTIKGVDTPGEWCVDMSGYIYYYPKADEKITDIEFRIPVAEKLITIQSGSFCFKNIVFEHTSFRLSENGCEFGQAANRMSAAIEADDILDTKFEDCEIRNTANYGIWLRKGCKNSQIINSYFHDLGAGAIKVGTIDKTEEKDITNHITIKNNIVNQYGVLMENAVGIILFRAADCKISHNDIHNGYYSGISLGWVWGYAESPTKRNDVSYNNISNIGDGRLNDLGGIYLLGESDGTHIHHNFISDVVSGDFRGWGIYADEGTSGILVDYNLVTCCTSGGYHQHYGKGNVVTNNIFAWGKKSLFTLTSAKEDNPLVLTRNIFITDNEVLMNGGGVNSKTFTIGKNCYWTISDESPKVQGKDVFSWIQQRDLTSIIQDPSFRNPQKGDFRLKNKSICRVIEFEPFDNSKAGVYGKRKWRKLAQSLR